jgi:pimeloyl-ACP methyl ester carboxylesterase
MSTQSSFPGQMTEWNDFRRHDFTIDGVNAILVRPHEPAEGAPWIWRARFFDAWPTVDLALLSLGFHLAYVDVVDLFGGEEAMGRFDALHVFATQEAGLASKVVLEGFSRGGLPVYHWASRHPENVCCIYCDAPVCDIRSWPGGKGLGAGDLECWAKCLRIWGLSEEEADQFCDNPIDRLARLATAGIPILHVCGETDESVPVAENTNILAVRYRELGGRIEVILKPGIGHHPHSLEDPRPIVEFILEAWNARV